MTVIKKTGTSPAFRSFFNDLWDRDDFFNRRWLRDDWTPAVNVKEEANEYEVDLIAPGLKKDDFNLNIENGVLTVSAETKKEEEEKDKNFTRKEFSYKSFSRSFTLPENIDLDKVDARYEDGLLKVLIAKKETETNGSSLKIKVE